MAYDTDASAEYVHKFAKRMESQWAKQSSQDQIFLDLDQRKNRFTIAVGKDIVQATALRSGIPGTLVDEDAALITVTPFAHVNPPTDSESDRRHASEVLEPWLQAGLKRSQQGPVWNRGPRSMRCIGRAWFFVSQDAPTWYDNDEYKNLLEDYEKSGDDKKIKDFKRDHWPIRWRYVDARNTWSYFEGRHWLPEVVEIKELTKLQVGDLYPGKLPPEYEKSHDSRKIKVIEYANHKVCKTVICGNKAEDATEVYSWEHGLGMNPYVLMEAELMSENDDGLRWKPAMYHAIDLIETFDQLLSDLRQNHIENTRTPLLQVVDPEFADEDVKVASTPPTETWEPGGTYGVWKGSEPMLAPVPQINQQSIFLIDTVRQAIRENAMRPIERGEAKAGQSNNLFVTAVQIAEREFDPSMQAITEAWEQVCKLHFRAVLALNRQYPDKPDKVAVFGEFKSKDGKNKKSIVEVGPDDVRGWENAIQAVASRAIPMDRNQQVSVGQGLANLRVPYSIIQEQELGYENTDSVSRQFRREALVNAAFDQVAIPAVVARATAVIASPSSEQQQQMAQQFPEAPQPMQDVLEQFGQAPGNVRQSMSNTRRAGVFQAPQQNPVA